MRKRRSTGDGVIMIVAAAASKIKQNRNSHKNITRNETFNANGCQATTTTATITQ